MRHAKVWSLVWLLIWGVKVYDLGIFTRCNVSKGEVKKVS